MSSNKAYQGTKPVPFSDTTKTDLTLNFGIYKGLVKKIDQETRNGSLWVYIEEFGHNNPDIDKSWTKVTYASPFGGVTPGPTDIGPTVNITNNFYYTQQSYGMFMTPPDVGNQVLCCFPQGKTTEGYWFACINPNLSRHMAPAIGGVPFDQIDLESISNFPNVSSLVVPRMTVDGRDVLYPVGEFNRNDLMAYVPGWSNKLWPLHIPLTLQLINQGLDQDPSRGAISSSPQRDTISSVFGISSPGRPIPTQDPANIPDIRQKLIDGKIDSLPSVTLRVQGHSIVMDDGDFYGNTNLMRFRTAAGHQIMMNDTDGFIYISNASGNSWVELTKNGDILIYSGGDLAVRTQGNLMMHSDRDVMINAGRNFNVHAGSKINMEAQVVQNNARSLLNLYGTQAQLKSGSKMDVVSSGSMSIKSVGLMALNGARISLNGQGGASAAKEPAFLTKNTLPTTIKSGGVWAILPDSVQSIVYKLPSHEPYLRSGNVEAVLAQQQAGIKKSIDGTPINPPRFVNKSGIDNANKQANVKQAPKSAFKKQPKPISNGMGKLTSEQLQALMAAIANIESGGSGGYLAIARNKDTGDIESVGKYQFVGSTLAALGYTKTGTTSKVLENAENWTGKDGINNLQDYLTSTAVQEKIMESNINSNYNTLQRYGFIKDDTPVDEIAGLLAAAHNIGPGDPNRTKSPFRGVYWWYTGTPQDIGYPDMFYNTGRWAVQPAQVELVVSANNSRDAGSAPQ